MTIPGKKAAAAKENEVDTNAKISAGLKAATTAASMATANKANFDKITRPSADLGLRALPGPMCAVTGGAGRRRDGVQRLARRA